MSRTRDPAGISRAFDECACDGEWARYDHDRVGWLEHGTFSSWAGRAREVGMLPTFLFILSTDTYRGSRVFRARFNPSECCRPCSEPLCFGRLES